MSETLFTTEQKSNAAEFTVSEISNALKRTVEDAFGNVRVRGEISGYRGPHSSGHAYFSLKDDRARIEAVIWKMTFQRLKFRPEEGMEVIATGRLTTYPGSSKYQIVIDSLEPAGAGALMALLEERKRRLAAEGLFDAARKKPLPFLPRVIGVITSPTGAVIRDILHRVRDRFPLHVLVWPVRVQGDTVGAEVSNAVAGFNALPLDGPIPRPDLLIVARGGGSLEDLWGFNDEALARAVAASRIPVISAVGHETDTTLVDFVSDRRAPTPTGAAEIAVPVKAELETTLASLGARLRACMSRGVDRRRQALKGAARALPSPDQLLAMPRRRLDEATSRLGRALIADTEKKRGRLSTARLSPAILARRVAEARRRFEKDGEQLSRCGRAYLRHRRADLDKAAARLRVEPIAGRLQTARQLLDRSAARLAPAAMRRLSSIGTSLGRQEERLGRSQHGYLQALRTDFDKAAARLRVEPIVRRAEAARTTLDRMAVRADQAMELALERRLTRLGQASRLFDSLGYTSVLKRGYAVVKDADGAVVKTAAEVRPGAGLKLEFADGEAGAVATGTATPRKPAYRLRSKATIPGQGSLF